LRLARGEWYDSGNLKGKGTAMFGLGFQEILLIFVLALLLFGAKKLPDVGRALGQTIKEFKRALSGTDAHEQTPEDAATHGDTKQS